MIHHNDKGVIDIIGKKKLTKNGIYIVMVLHVEDIK